MITYTTRFPVNDNFDKYAFVSTVIRWNQGSRFDKINSLIWDTEKYECQWCQDNITLSINEIDIYGIVASRLKKEDESGIWCTDFILDIKNKMLSVSVTLETTDFTTDFYPSYYPPYFVKMVIFGGYAGDDNGILVSNEEHDICECIDFYRGVINKTININLPVVYIKRTIFEESSINVNRLAFRLQGVAHVIYEPSERSKLNEFSDILDLSDETSGQIIIYYPSYNKKNKILNPSGQCIEATLLEDRIVNDVYSYMNSRMRKMIDTWEGVLTEKLHIENRKLLSNLSDVEKENMGLYDLFGEQFDKIEESNVRLSNEVQRLTTELQMLRMKYSDKNKIPILYLGEEKEFYTDEIKEIVLDIMAEYLKNCKAESRRWHIISDLLDSNEFKGIPQKRKEKLKNALKGYKTLNGSLKNLLETLGFEISDDGKHYKWTYYGDHRYVATAAKTCSDGRAGMNLSSIIDKLMF